MEINGKGLDGWIGGWDILGDRGQSGGVFFFFPFFCVCCSYLSCFAFLMLYHFKF